MNTQDKFMQVMEKIAEDNGLDLITDQTYSNVGRVSFQPSYLFEPILSFSFNFQSGYASFKGDLGETPRECDWPYVVSIPQGRYRTLDQFVQCIKERLAFLTGSG